MPHINFPQARYYQTKIQAYFPAQAQRGSARISTPSVREGRTRVLLPGSGTEAMRIDVDDWDALDAIYVAGSDEETETTEGPPNLPKASASDVDVVSLFECCVCLDTYHRPVVTTCMHVFCAGCLQRLLSRRCPMCRRNLGEIQLRDALFEAELAKAIAAGVVAAPSV